MSGKQMLPCPGCGIVRECRSAESLCQSCRGDASRKLTGERLAWAIDQVREHRAAEETARYMQLRIQRRPWLTMAEAAQELDVTVARISQLAAGGTLHHRTEPGRTAYQTRKYVSAADVYAYTPTPEKKTRTK
ncbi:hypothetical protein PBI_BRIDGETTE_45 [Arthrobacter phage Bridgette]|uniref:Uncharacterized protein n=1 Tax=Arthrobacter phage Bridgette TaxID=2419949 RepID=A0A3G2KED5_9CAUD|nr:hypothetical protein HOU46_gp45 [Arthrobacter phage Bridgette]AYN57311.1 hypothetical protein PBI_BRIDGETTE_45 [Arthrobacter phage Bridgette]